jgi:ATP-dependent DNA helicase RecG
VIKYSDRAEADRVFNYLYEAIEEALANAVYHKNYELAEPIEVRILPTSIEIISYNGIVPSLKQADFDKGIVRARRYRNSRIGEFLKELKLTEGKGTGIPTIMQTLSKNGSPKPIFDTNEPERAFFISEFLIHSSFEMKNELIVQALKLNEQQKKVLEFCKNPKSRAEILEFLKLKNHSDNCKKYIFPLLEIQILKLTIPDNPKNRNQQYVISEKG